jgi:hypothetical protein
MKTYYLFTLLLLTLMACGEAEEQFEANEDVVSKLVDSTETQVQESILLTLDSADLPDRILNEPEMILGQADGDLDKDGIAEKVVVFESLEGEDETGMARILVIYKQENGGWIEWVNTDQAILRSDEGGMMGDPFDGIDIANGILVISHWGGSSWKWSHTDKYRYQNEAFHLIGYSSNYGKPCEYWEDYDYNLSTGDCVFNFEPDICEEYAPDGDYGPKREEKFNHKIKELPKLNNRRGFEYTFKSPKGEEIYL